MGRPATKTFLGTVTTEIKLGSLREPLAREGDAESLYLSDLIRREVARFLLYRGHRIDRRFLDPPPIRARLAAGADAESKP